MRADFANDPAAIHMYKAYVSLVLSFLFAAVLPAAPAPVPHGTVELISDTRSVQPGTPLKVGLRFQLEPGWHIYWKNPGDSGQAPRIQWALPNGVTAGPIEWPTPKRLPVGPLLDYGYEGDVLLPVTLQTAKDLSDARVEAKGNLRVLVCRESCIPGKASLSLELPVSNGPAAKIAANDKLFRNAELQAAKPAPADWKVSAQAGKDAIALHVAGMQQSSEVQFFPANPGQIENAAPQEVKTSAQGLEIRMKRASDSTSSLDELAGLLIVPQPGGASPAGYEISAKVDSVPSSPVAPAPQAATNSDNLLTILALAFLGGLILNLMPCVFPVLSIKALHLLESAGKNHRTIRVSAVAYTLGVLVSFWVLVAALLALRAGGTHLGWGFQLQSPPFVAFLVCLLFALGLSLAGMFEIGQSFMSVGSGLAQKNGYTGSFFTGVLATVVATPCTAPFMGAAVGFALGASTAACVAVFTSMAIGLASPFLLLAFAPQLGRYLPRPGRWMETLKQALAFLIFGTVIWLLWVFGQQVDINQLAMLLFSLLVISFAGWMLGRWPRNRVAFSLAALFLLAAIVYPLVSISSSARVAAAKPGVTNSGLPWQPFTKEALANYRASGKPVLIDFTAAWCLTCQVNDRVVFRSDAVEQRLKNSNIALLRADWTSYDPAITETLAQYRRSGVPLYVLYGAKQDAPVILPDGILRTSTLLSALDSLKL